MTVYVVTREDQNDHGFVDFSITGIFLDKRAATEQVCVEQGRARKLGLRVEDDEGVEADWQVSWKLEEYEVR